VTDERPRIGISACLLGDEVRYDGGHKRDAFLADVLRRHVTWVRVCPEVEVGMGTPRETLHLVRDDSGSIRMVTTGTKIDHTDSMRAWAEARLGQLARQGLDGYVLKQDSPSCGVDRVKLFDVRTGTRERAGRGIFAAALLARFPNLPVEEEGKLSDPVARWSFLERVFAHNRLRALFEQPWTRADLLAFHDAHRLTLLSHSADASAALDRMIAASDPSDEQALVRRYEDHFMRALRIPAARERHTEVLLLIAARMASLFGREEYANLLACIDEYRNARVSLAVPLAAIRQHHVDDLIGQTYLHPFPLEIAFEDHA
jgi:uncharacterized protein YbbK (DUF523 family)/uncharacterized protein YbgA (DUF1722 family)